MEEVKNPEPSLAGGKWIEEDRGEEKKINSNNKFLYCLHVPNTILRTVSFLT